MHYESHGCEFQADSEFSSDVTTVTDLGKNCESADPSALPGCHAYGSKCATHNVFMVFTVSTPRRIHATHWQVFIPLCLPLPCGA